MQYSYEKFFERKLRELAKESRVVDIGGGEPFQKGMAHFRELFKNSRYETLDSSPIYASTVVGDAHNLPFGDNQIPAIISKSVFEHLHDPKRAAEEIYRVLKPGGKVLVYTHFIYPYHARAGVYKDYFRFTEDGLRYLFRDFSHIEVKKHGGYFLALMYFFPWQHRLKIILEPIAYALDRILKTEGKTTTAGYYVYAVK